MSRKKNDDNDFVHQLTLQMIQRKFKSKCVLELLLKINKDYRDFNDAEYCYVTYIMLGMLTVNPKSPPVQDLQFSSFPFFFRSWTSGKGIFRFSGFPVFVPVLDLR